MKRWLRIVLVAVLVLAGLVFTLLGFMVGWRPLLLGPATRPLTARTFEATPERLERGRYLVTSVYGCAGCHSERDWSQPGAPAMAGREFAGVVWAAEGMPWLTASNISPDKETGAGNWSDDTLARAIR